MPALRRRIGLVDASQASYGWMTAEEAVLTGIGSTARPIWGSYSADDQLHARDLLMLLGCGDLAERHLSTLSQGEYGRVRIARALIAEPSLLLLDEPAVGLDLAAREALIAALDRLSAERADLTVVIVTHHLEEIPRSVGHALLLREGGAVSCGPIEEALTSEHLSACFGLPIECTRLEDRWSARSPAEWARVGALV
jgi:iron complex transport system ATP-binding protein